MSNHGYFLRKRKLPDQGQSNPNPNPNPNPTPNPKKRVKKDPEKDLKTVCIYNVKNIFELASEFKKQAQKLKCEGYESVRISTPFGVVTLSRNQHKDGIIKVRDSDGPCSFSNPMVAYSEIFRGLFTPDQTEEQRKAIIEGIINISIASLTEEQQQCAGILLSLALISEESRREGAQFLFIIALHMLKDKGLGDYQNAQEYFESFFSFCIKKGDPRSIMRSTPVTVGRNVRYRKGGQQEGEVLFAYVAHLLAGSIHSDEENPKNRAKVVVDYINSIMSKKEESELSKYLQADMRFTTSNDDSKRQREMASSEKVGKYTALKLEAKISKMGRPSISEPLALTFGFGEGMRTRSKKRSKKRSEELEPLLGKDL